MMQRLGRERQITAGAYGHLLTNTGCWTRDSQWIVFDTRSDPAGTQFDGTKIERVHVQTGEIERLFETREGACVGVVTCAPKSERIVFIQGPDHPTLDWSYGPTHRRGALLDLAMRGVSSLDAVCVTEPFIAGALRGGSHVHTFDDSERFIAFTYEDHVLEFGTGNRVRESNQRNVGVCLLNYPVPVRRDHPRNVDGTAFSVLVTRTWDSPEPGTDQISRAYEDAWVGKRGYSVGSQKWQPAIAFLGDTRSQKGEKIAELFVVDLPHDLTKAPDEGHLQGTRDARPRPPAGTRQRRLTFTHDRTFPGISGPRHWPRSTPDGSKIVFLMKDESGVSQLWSVGPWGGEPQQVSSLEKGVSSSFTISSCGKWIAHVTGNSIAVTGIDSGQTQLLTNPADPGPRPEACVFSPDDRQIAYVRSVAHQGETWNQVFVVERP